MLKLIGSIMSIIGTIIKQQHLLSFYIYFIGKNGFLHYPKRYYIITKAIQNLSCFDDVDLIYNMILQRRGKLWTNFHPPAKIHQVIIFRGMYWGNTIAKKKRINRVKARKFLASRIHIPVVNHNSKLVNKLVSKLVS